MKTLHLSVALLASALITPSHSALASLAPPPPTVSWSQEFAGSWTWSAAKNQAANLVEGGYSDWRLPTRAEFQSAIQGATLPALSAGTYLYWTSEKQGNRAWAVTIATDASGNVIPSQSGGTSLILQASFVHAIAIRP